MASSDSALQEPPTKVERYEDGSLKREEWLVDGKEHRVGGRGVVNYYANGIASWTQWSLFGTPHRLEGPAHEGRWADGSIDTQSWQVDGLLQRVDGPAYTEYNADGSVKREAWFWRGRPMSNEQIHAPEFGVARSNTEALDLLVGLPLDDLSPEHPTVVLALQLFPNG